MYSANVVVQILSLLLQSLQRDFPFKNAITSQYAIYKKT